MGKHTRKLYKKKRATRKVKGGGQNCYKLGKNSKTWSCSTQCGKDGDCEPFD